MNPRVLPAHVLCALLFTVTTTRAQDPVVETPTEEATPARSTLDVTIGAATVQMRLVDPEGAPVDEFVKAIASVTGEVYLFEGGVLEEVADRKVSFLGTLDMERGRVADTAAALLRTIGIRDSLEVDGDGQPVHRLRLREMPAPGSIDEVTESFAVKIDGNTIRLSVIGEDGGDPIELMRIVEFLEGTVFVYHRDELQEAPQANRRNVRGRQPRNPNNNVNGVAGRIHFVGEVVIPKDRLLARVSGIFASSGWLLAPMRSGAFDVIEVINENGRYRNTLGRRALRIPVDRLSEYADWGFLLVQTIVEFEHVNANSAASQLRPFFATMSSQSHQILTAPIGDDGTALIMSGGVQMILRAVQILEEADVPRAKTRRTQLVELAHIEVDRAVTILTTLFPKGQTPQQTRRPESVRIVAQGPGRIVVSGTPTMVEEVLDAIATIDVKDDHSKK